MNLQGGVKDGPNAESAYAEKMTEPPTAHLLPKFDLAPPSVISAARATFANWKSALGLLILRQASPWFNRRVDLNFRDGSPRLVGVSAREIRFVLGTIYVAQKMGLQEGPPTSARTLLAIARSIERSILGVYSESDVRVGRTGGWPGLKEILLYSTIRRLVPQLAIETGVAQGISTFVILEAMRLNREGRLISVDLRRMTPPDNLGKDSTYVKSNLEPGWLVPTNLRGQWTLIEGRSEEVLPLRNDRIELFCHDSLHTYQHMMFEYSWALEHLRIGGALISDDISWNRAFRDFVKSHVSQVRVISSREVGLAVKLSC